jgi:transglutaminase/protease-like cytokinesis protein 3
MAARILQDEVVKLLAYDFESTEDGLRRKQDAASVLSTELAVCKDYATPHAGLLRSVGIPAAYVGGDAGGRHAWSCVLDGTEWAFVDTTWDDPVMNGHSDYPLGENLCYDYFWKDGFADHTVEEVFTDRGVQVEPSESTQTPGHPPGWY